MGPRETAARELAEKAKGSVDVLSEGEDDQARAGIAALVALLCGLAIDTAAIADRGA